MLFHTLPFLLFMLVVLPVFYLLRRTPLWTPWLLLASYFFYGWWNPYYLLLIFYSTALDYTLVALMDHCPGRREQAALPNGPRDRALSAALVVSIGLTIALVIGAIAGPAALRPTFWFFSVLVGLMALGAYLRSRRVWLLISIVNNLALLLFFKYARFAIQNLAFLGLHLPDPSTLMPPGFTYALPVGISFFTFQSMSYTIDFYLGNVERERGFLRFATFVCFFPQLMAGPIERAKHLLPQFRRTPVFRLENLTDGMSLFLVGLFKKLALANYLALYVERVYDNPAAQPASALVRVADLLRLQRLHRHGARRGQNDGLQPHPELQQPLFGDGSGRFLVTVAHQPLVVVPRLRLHPAGRK